MIHSAAMDVFTRFYQYAAALSALALIPAYLMTRRMGFTLAVSFGGRRLG